MSPSHTKRLAPDALGLKALITTTSLAVTLGGWAVLAVEQPTTPSAEAPITDTVAIQPPASGFELNMAPLPTIVQAPPPPPKIVVATPPPAAIQSSTRPAAVHVASQPAQPVAQPAAQPQPAVQPQPAAQPAAQPQPGLPPLRVVSAPPKPVARTRSSR